jgi:Leucine-rich repeat (LRR) protein
MFLFIRTDRYAEGTWTSSQDKLLPNVFFLLYVRCVYLPSPDFSRVCSVRGVEARNPVTRGARAEQSTDHSLVFLFLANSVLDRPLHPHLAILHIMLGSDRFAFETPNVIDPGELPPSRPTRDPNDHRDRRGSAHSHTLSTSSPSSSTDSSVENDVLLPDETYRQVRASPARLLQSISDLELCPQTDVDGYYGDGHDTSVPYDPYDAEYGESVRNHTYNESYNHHRSFANQSSASLPTVEEARMHASALLVDKRKGESKPLARTVRVGSSSSQHLVRKRILALAKRFGLVAALIAVGIILSVALVSARKPQNGEGANDEVVMDRRESILVFLGENRYSDVEAMLTPGTPQFRAVEWMAEVDMLRTSETYAVLYNLDGTPQEVTDLSNRFLQRYVLVLFYYATQSSTGWVQTYNFLMPMDECAWNVHEHVADFQEEKYDVGVSCNSNLQVNQIFLPQANLQGSLPTELGLLTSIRFLGLPRNRLNGTLPETMSNMWNLLYLDLNYNLLSGNLPMFLGDFQYLEVLGLSNNEWFGPLPASLGSLQSLKTLAIDDNVFTGSIDFINYLPNLEFFYADSNLLGGLIDDNFLSGSSKLTQLDLSGNEFRSSSFPAHLLQHPALQILDLSNNKLSGPLPTQALDKNNVLQFLSLRENNLSGPLQATTSGTNVSASATHGLGTLRRLTHLDLAQNSLTGAVPYDWRHLQNLSYLSLSQNSLTPAPIPNFLDEFTNLRELSLQGLNMTLGIPGWLGRLSNLELLDLSFNDLEGSIPRDVFDLPSLTYLMLHRNRLTGNIPPDLVAAEKLLVVTLHKNEMNADMNTFCREAINIGIFATDCVDDSNCTEPCCMDCCDANDNLCYEDELADFLKTFEGMWEFQYSRASYSMDPVILAESNVTQSATNSTP